MMGPVPRDGPPIVVHVLPAPLRRGAQRYAHDLLGALAARGSAFDHELWFLFPPSRDDDGSRSTLPAMTRLRRSGFDPLALVRLRRRLAGLRPAIVVSHGGEPLKYLALAAPRIPIVYLKIGLAAPAARRVWRRPWHRWLVRRAAAVVGVSSEVSKEVIEEFGARESSVQVISNGRDPKVFRPGPDRAMHDPPVVLFVGHMTGTKRPHVFLEVVARLQRWGIAVHGRMVGDGHLLEEVRAHGRRLGVEVLGGMDDVVTEYVDADLLLFTSVREGEGMPGVLVEAAMCGLPIVTTRVPGATDVVRHGRTGLVVEAEDVDGLARACATVLSEPDRWSGMGARARRAAVESFGLDAGAARWEALLIGLHDDCSDSPAPA